VCIAGCGNGGERIWVTGNLTKAGAKYAVPDGQHLNVTFVALETQGKDGKPVNSNEPYAAELNLADGSFTVPGPDRTGIPPGKYRVSVIQKWTREGLKSAKPEKGKKFVDRETDILANKYGVETSPIIRELKTSGAVNVDLDKPAG
jgi:hypothetical protein